jgi:hypothetical protein
MPANFYHPTRRHIPEDSNLNLNNILPFPEKSSSGINSLPKALNMHVVLRIINKYFQCWNCSDTFVLEIVFLFINP